MGPAAGRWDRRPPRAAADRNFVGAAPCGRPRAHNVRPYGNTHRVGRGILDAPLAMRLPSRQAPRKTHHKRTM